MTAHGGRVVEVAVHRDPLSLSVDLEAGQCVVVDADALASDAGQGEPVPGLLFDAVGDEAADRARRLLAQAAGEVVDAVEAASTGASQRILIRGTGALAAAVRALAGIGHTLVDDWEDAPTVFVDTTGSSDAFGAALNRLPDLGVLVTTGDAPTPPMSVDPYPDLHRRALVLVGVPGLAHDRAVGEPDDGGSSSALTGPQRVEVGRPVVAAAQWMQVEAAEIDPTADSSGDG